MTVSTMKAKRTSVHAIAFIILTLLLTFNSIAYPPATSSQCTSALVPATPSCELSMMYTSTFVLIVSSFLPAYQTSTASTSTASSAATSSGAAQLVASLSPSLPLSVSAKYRQMDNFDNYETILRWVDDVSEFLSENIRQCVHFLLQLWNYCAHEIHPH